jgi:16S rRNA (guanine527-N7)-methyltransferase
VSEIPESTAARLNAILALAGLDALDPPVANRFQEYCSLLLRWNARMNLTAIRDEEGILSRHFVESIACARALPTGIATLLDFGSGAGFPGLPIALCRPELTVTLAESQGKKAAFLREAVRTLRLSASVHSGRAELIRTRFDCITLRAVDHMPEAVRAATGLVSPGGCLALMTTGTELERLQESSAAELSWLEPVLLPGGESRLLAFAKPAAAPKPDGRYFGPLLGRKVSAREAC